MNNSIRFACTSLIGQNKVGNLKKDENGYYEVIVGALNVFNSAGQFYVFEQAKQLFEESGQLMRRVKRGVLKGEYGHPKREVGMSNDAFANRCLTINEHLMCCHHKEITLDFNRVKDEKGNPVIAIIAKTIPSGPYGHVLEKSLENKDENVCFSIRAFTDDYFRNGVTERVLRTIVTWDYVNEPGIAHAEKFKAPSLEELHEVVFSRGNIERAAKQSQTAGFGHESVAVLTAQELMHSMGWDVTQQSSKKPAYARW